MFNKFVIVLALLTTLSMATKLEFLSRDSKCEYGTLQEVKDKSTKIFYSNNPNSLDNNNQIRASFMYKLAEMAVTNPSEYQTYIVRMTFQMYIPESVFNYVREKDYLMARKTFLERIWPWENSFKNICMHFYIKSYIKILLETNKERTPSSCLTLSEYTHLFSV
jgi:hypothetical protein